MSQYGLTKSVYYQTVWFIRQTDDKRGEYETLAWESVEQDGQPKGTAPGDPTGTRAIRAARLSEDIGAVEKALEQIPEYYREPVYRNIVNRERWPLYANRKTYAKNKRKFIFFVAYLKNWI